MRQQPRIERRRRRRCRAIHTHVHTYIGNEKHSTRNGDARSFYTLGRCVKSFVEQPSVSTS